MAKSLDWISKSDQFKKGWNIYQFLFVNNFTWSTVFVFTSDLLIDSLIESANGHNWIRNPE